MTDPSRFEVAFARFDRINAADPRSESVSGSSEPKELVYARRMSQRLADFEPAASEALRLAARAQHIARWKISRSEYPAGRKGYRAWRSRLMQFHAKLASNVLVEVGYEAAMIQAVSRLIRKQGLTREPDAQTLEDVACLVFLEHYFDEFSDHHEDEKLVSILRKTWAKMSERGRETALRLEMSRDTRRRIHEAVSTSE